MVAEYTVATDKKGCFDITGPVRRFIADSGVQNGLCLVSLPHKTAGLGLTSVWDTAGITDMMDEFWRMVPARVSYRRQDAPLAVAAQAKAALAGKSLALLVRDGQPVLGHSQWLVVLEFFGPRTRRYQLQMLAG